MQQNYQFQNQQGQMNQNSEEVLFTQFKQELQNITQSKILKIQQIQQENFQIHDGLEKQTQELIDQLSEQIQQKFKEFLEFMDTNVLQIGQDEQFIQMVQNEVLKFIEDQNYYQQSLIETKELKKNLDQMSSTFQQEINTQGYQQNPQAPLQNKPPFRPNEQSTGIQQNPPYINQQFSQQQEQSRPQNNIKGQIVSSTVQKNAQSQNLDFMFTILNSGQIAWKENQIQVQFTNLSRFLNNNQPGKQQVISFKNVQLQNLASNQQIECILIDTHSQTILDKKLIPAQIQNNQGQR